MTDISVSEQPEQTTAVIREVVPLTGMTAFFGRAFSTVASVVAAEGAQITGPAFARYYGMPTDVVDVEAGFPIAGAITASGDVHVGHLPSGRIYEAIHVGPYDTLVQTYEAVGNRISADGGVPADEMWEYYLSDPEDEPDPAKWQTRVCWPVSSSG